MIVKARGVTAQAVPAMVPYVYGARRPLWTIRAIQRAEAEHGTPVPVCSGCGRQLRVTRNRGWPPDGRCPACSLQGGG